MIDDRRQKAVNLETVLVTLVVSAGGLFLVSMVYRILTDAVAAVVAGLPK